MTTPAAFPRDVPPMWLLVSLLSMLGLHFLLPGGRWLHPPFTWIGIVVVAAGVALAAGSAWRFQRAGTGVRPFTPASTLVVAGAYRWTRNPMYVGLVCIVAGVATVLGTWSPAVVPPAFLLLLDRRFVRAEEAFMRQRFGASFDDYCRRVRRWL